MNVKVLVLLYYLVVPAIAISQARPYRTGFIHEDLSKTAPGHQIASVRAAPGATRFRDTPRVGLSGEVPPIGDQGTQCSRAG